MLGIVDEYVLLSFVHCIALGHLIPSPTITAGKFEPLSLVHRWQEYRAKAEAFYGLPVIPRSCTGRYSGKYSPMKLNDAVTPTHFERFPFYPDESPDVLLPIGNTGYTGNTYH